MAKQPFGGAGKVGESLLAGPEKRLVAAFVPKVPRWLETYHLTMMTLLWSALVVLFGWLARKRMGWAFILGMLLYFVDGLIFLLVQDWLSIGFHAFALFCIFGGYASLKKLAQMEGQQAYSPV